MDDVLGRQREFHRAIYRKVQFVDFAIAFLMLDFPHPLFADDIDFQRVRRRNFFVKICFCAPRKNSHRDERGNDCPGDFDFHFWQMWMQRGSPFFRVDI